ncbi:MAG: GNAT family N-acetyltransferase [Chloroflexota bacterium]|jgi:RimJ/RimL family protein N-acetyltransferase
MMDMLMERGNFIQALQRQVSDELVRAKTWSRPTPFANKSTAEELILRDGTAVSLRPIQANDLRPLWHMHQRLSATTLYYRYLQAYNPSLTDLAQICHLDDEVGGALVVTSGRLYKKMVAVAYYIKDKRQPQTAEAAFLVEDRFQGRGLGQILLQRLSQYGRERGLTTFKAFIHPDNVAMLHIIQRSGLTFTEEVAYDLREIRVQIGSERMVSGLKETKQ